MHPHSFPFFSSSFHSLLSSLIFSQFQCCMIRDRNHQYCSSMATFIFQEKVVFWASCQLLPPRSRIFAHSALVTKSYEVVADGIFPADPQRVKWQLACVNVTAPPCVCHLHSSNFPFPLPHFGKQNLDLNTVTFPITPSLEKRFFFFKEQIFPLVFVIA